MTGLIGFSSGYYAMLDCDVLLVLGSDFPYRQFYPQGPDVHIAQVDIRAENLGRRAAVELGVVGDVRATLTALLPRLTPKRDATHLTQARKHYLKSRTGLDELARGNPGSGLIHPQQIAQVISERAAEDAIFTCDVGLPTVWAARYLSMNGKRRLLGSFLHGSMANAMAQSIGAQAACPGRQVIALSGDGGFTMLMGDFLTLVQQRLPVKVVVFNNGALGFIELEQRASGFISTGTELANPNFATMAEAIGIRGIRLEDPKDVESGITAEQRGHRRFERRPVGEAILHREHHQPQLGHGAAIGLQVDGLRVEQRPPDRNDDEAAAAHVRALLVPQRQLSGQLRVLIDARLDLQGPVDQLGLGEVIDQGLAIVFAVASAGDPADQVVAIGGVNGRIAMNSVDRSPGQGHQHEVRFHDLLALIGVRTSVATVHRSSRL
jgi:hypothetical protein